MTGTFVELFRVGVGNMFCWLQLYNLHESSSSLALLSVAVMRTIQLESKEHMVSGYLDFYKYYFHSLALDNKSL